MNLILQAVKSLFRKLENSLATLTKKITMAQSTANTAYNTAIKAQVAANNARNLANNAQDLADNVQYAIDKAKYCFTATLKDNSTLQVTGCTLKDGKIYTIIPDASSTNLGTTGKIYIGGKTLPIKAGVTGETAIYGGKQVIPCNTFKQGVPMVMIYSETRASMYLITQYVGNYVPVESAQVNSAPGKYIYGQGIGSKVVNKYIYMRVRSSTEGSTEEFDIKVDDDGHLSTVRVKTGEIVEAGVSDDHINTLIDAKLGVIENGTY